MKKYEGRSENFYFDNYNFIVNRNILSNGVLYPGDTWKETHYILFGYYPENWEDMTTYTMNSDKRNIRISNDTDYKYKIPFLNISPYRAIYEIIKFVTGKEPLLDKKEFKSSYFQKSVSINMISSYLKWAINMAIDYNKRGEEYIQYAIKNPSKGIPYLQEKIGSNIDLGIKEICAYKIFFMNKGQKNRILEIIKKKKDKIEEISDAINFDKIGEMIEIDKDYFTKKMSDKITSKFSQSIRQFIQESINKGQKEIAIKAIKSSIFKISVISIIDGKLNCKIYNNQIIFELSNDTNIRYYYNAVEMKTA